MKHIAFFVLFTAFFITAGFAQTDLQTVATVNLTRSEAITVRQLRVEVDKLEKAAGRTLTVPQRREVLDAMINEKLAFQGAESSRLPVSPPAPITVSENELNQQINQLRAQMVQAMGRQPTDVEFATAVRNETGLELPAFRDQLRRQLVMQKYLMSKKQSLIDGVRAPTDTDILNTYNLTRSNFVRPDTVRFSMIQVPFGDNAATKTRAREQATGFAREIGSNPTKFDEIVLRGQAANSGYQAGDASYLPRNLEAAQIVGQEFINIAFSLRQGEVSGVIEGQRAFQIIKITETYTMRNLELDDIFQLGTRMTVREYIRNVLMQERQMEALTQAQQELVAELRAAGTVQIFERYLNW